jgi:ABC-2 type transport system ATP-binding protein
MIIEVENLKKVYKKNFRTVYALKGIGFQLEKNKILGILGPNGAGKTTLLKIITGITTPDKDSGGVKLFGSGNIGEVKGRIGFLPENPEFFRNISARELLEFSLRVSGGPYDSRRIDDMLKRVNLFHERNERVKNFSKGMRQRIGIAQAIIHSPELLILDEPMSGLDPPGRRMVIDLIEHYYKEGRTIIFSTHNLDDIEALCTDVMVLNGGEILLEKSLRQLRRNSSYRIELEGETGKQVVTAENAEGLWQILEQAKDGGVRIVKVQSGIARQLEEYYRDIEPVAQDAPV